MFLLLCRCHVRRRRIAFTPWKYFGVLAKAYPIREPGCIDEATFGQDGQFPYAISLCRVRVLVLPGRTNVEICPALKGVKAGKVGTVCAVP